MTTYSWVYKSRKASASKQSNWMNVISLSFPKGNRNWQFWVAALVTGCYLVYVLLISNIQHDKFLLSLVGASLFGLLIGAPRLARLGDVFLLGRRSINYSIDESGLQVVKGENTVRRYRWGDFLYFYLPVDVQAIRDATEIPEVYKIAFSDRFYLRKRTKWFFGASLTVLCSPAEREIIIEVVANYLPHKLPFNGLFHRDVTTDATKSKFWTQFAIFLSVGLAIVISLAGIIYMIYRHL